MKNLIRVSIQIFPLPVPPQNYIDWSTVLDRLSHLYTSLPLPYIVFVLDRLSHL